MSGFSGRRGFVLATAVAVGLALSACARNPTDADSAMNGAYGATSGPGSIGEFTSSVGDRVFFDTDSTELNAQGQATLDKQAAWLSRYPRYTFTIEGHADERGTREYNFALGSRRAESTKEYLIAKGIAASRMRTISFGKERPVAVCNDISCWSQNRRAVTVLAGGAGS